MIAPGFTSIAQATVSALAICTAMGFLIALFGLVVIRFTRSATAVTRFTVWFLALLSIAALPLVRSFVRLNIGNRIYSSHSPLTLPETWCWIIFYGWLMAAIVGLIKIAAGLVKLHLLAGRCKSVDHADLSVELQDALRRSPRRIQVLVSSEVRVPTAMGFLHPAIVLPNWVTAELSSVDFNNVVLHELAHLERWDDWTNLTQKILRAVLFFHPAVWWIDGRLSLEREMACDDRVIARTANARSYARCLLWLAERVSDKSLTGRAMALAQGAVSRLRDTSLRITRILTSAGAQEKRTSKLAIGLLAAFTMICGAGLQRMPDLLAFQNEAVAFPKLAYASEPVSTAAVIPATLKLANTERAVVQKHVSRRLKPVRTTEPRNQVARLAISSQRGPVLAAYDSQALEIHTFITQAVFVVMPSTLTDANFGPAVWSFTVWRIEVPVHKIVVEEQIPTKTT